jgi:hypothetical protein
MVKKIKFNQILEVSVDETETFKKVIQVVTWGDGAPALEKRSYFKKDGGWLCGKSGGFTRKDFIKCLKSTEKIKEALQEND